MNGWRSFLLLRNPFYLLSALLMLTGYYLMTGPFRENDDVGGVLALILIQAFYESVLLLLIVYLRKRHPEHPHRFWLIGIEILFLCDPTFLIEALYSVSSFTTIPVGLCWLLLSGAKLALLRWSLGRKGTIVGIIPQMLVMLVVSVAPRLMEFSPGNGVLADIAPWGCWTLLAMGFLGYLLPSRDEARQERSPFFRITAGMADLLPGVMGVGHLLACHFVSSIPVRPFVLAMPLLSLIFVAVVRIPPLRTIAGRLLLTGVVIALFLSRGSTFAISIDLPAIGVAQLTALTFVFAHSALCYLVLSWIWRRWLYLFPGVSMAFLLGTGGDLTLLGKGIPTTQQGWGIFMVLLAFGSLAAGFLSTILLQRRSSNHAPPPDQ
ncbi:MAG: hypothetical protein A2Z34_07710 [Planctomycetes bacterium RBG_16_59_8]|nr:MAG: hypothetical protein A2Z34_07710 [Planctomycetes bacterium RBG_16_59_8]